MAVVKTLYSTPTPVPIRLSYILLRFYCSIFPVTTFTTRYSPLSFTYIHITTRFPALLLSHSCGKSNIQHLQNTYKVVVGTPRVLIRMVGRQKTPHAYRCGCQHVPQKYTAGRALLPTSGTASIAQSIAFVIWRGQTPLNI